MSTATATLTRAEQDALSRARRGVLTPTSVTARATIARLTERGLIRRTERWDDRTRTTFTLYVLNEGVTA